MLRRYWEAWGSKVRSAKSNRHCINVWLDYWQETNVSALVDVKRQDEFHQDMCRRGFSPAGVECWEGGVEPERFSEVSSGASNTY